jgi:hypothetical protein
MNCSSHCTAMKWKVWKAVSQLMDWSAVEMLQVKCNDRETKLRAFLASKTQGPNGTRIPSLSLLLQFLLCNFTSILFIYYFYRCAGVGTLWHLHMLLQYIKHIILEFAPSIILLYTPPIPGTISTGIISPFTYMCTQYSHDLSTLFS